MKLRKSILLFSLVWSVLLLVGVTYSWIARSWTPQVEYPKVSIATTGALIISFEEEIGDAVYNEVKVNELLGLEQFALKQVSSLDGKYFVSANFNPILDGEVPIYDNNVNGKYVETEFWIKTQYESDDELSGKRKKVYIHEDSKIEFLDENGNDLLNVRYTIRISIELLNINNNEPYIFCANRGTDDGKEDGIYDETLFAAKLDAVGKNIYKNYPDDTSLVTENISEQICYDLNYFDGTSDDRVLFTIDPASNQKVVVRIWLEGCDEYCVNEIAGKNLSILLKFDSEEIE